MKDIQPGLYKHFKGNSYHVIGVGRDSEKYEPFVVYQGLYHSPDFGEHPIWIRPVSLFFDHIERGEYSGARFVKLADTGRYTCKDCGKEL